MKSIKTQSEKKRKMQLLLELARLISIVGRFSVPFGEMNELLGFRIAWLKKELAEKLFYKFGLDSESCEVIVMQADGLTECHLHTAGEGIFLPLDESHGALNPDGGTLMGDYEESHNIFNLTMTGAIKGKFFTIPAGKIHAFKANKNAGLTLIAIVSPKIRKGEDEFDVTPFRFLSKEEPFKVSLDFGSQNFGWRSCLAD
jgi:hypothetical protein